MPMRYYIVITTGWTFSAEAFLGRLRMRWPLVQIEKLSTSQTHTFQDFEFPMDRSVLYGSVELLGKGLTIDSGALEDCAEFAHWCRALIPPSEKVVFCHESMAIDFLLEPGMTPAEIAQAMRA
ncbi:hypothetical protein JRI60_44445 [Archangium violaceum]|uniref:hypothetical protein n=1 Tax=Archangium violaceum TaxID=83451 RepID=UPI001950B12C|nr:hypothetical protein [Archangium violaceum]QRN96008.1 hypothetical protein JRI60_44445 [Archangium violaceum]